MSPKRKPRTGAAIGAGSGGPHPKTSHDAPAGAGGRRPKSVLDKPGPEAGDSKPTFSFSCADRVYAGSWAWPEGVDAGELLDFLCEMGRLTWNEVFGHTTGSGRNRHKKHHFQPVSSLGPEACRRIADLGLVETFGEDIFRFRLGGEKRQGEPWITSATIASDWTVLRKNFSLS